MVPVLGTVEKEKQQDCLLKYLMVRLAAILMKLKPSCLLCLCNCEKSGGGDYYDLWKEQKAGIARKLKISFKELKDTFWGKQVLFYNPEVLFKTVTQPENHTFLKKFGYSSCKSIEDYLDTLKKRFCTFDKSDPLFPHEMGIFLGYPLKDVKGFIEKGTLPLTATGRWQVFGAPEESKRLMRMRNKAEKVFLNLIKNGRNPVSYIEQVSTHFKKAKDVAAIRVF
ncbi:MAG: DUF3793 family protein [Candidatus Omnitrophica bacterium]|nr:DUF3793 family protein [Candidatus Omnitrophota bacterium]